MKRFRLLPIILLFLTIPQSSPALSDYYLNNKMVRFDYYINDEFVLLYKLVNWWYSCEYDCQSFLCGRKIKLKLIGKNRLNKDLIFSSEFPELEVQIPVMNKNIQSMYKNADIVFYNTKIKVNISKLPKQTINKIRQNLSQTGFIIKGNISGILNSKVLLKKDPKAERKCDKTGNKVTIHLMDFKHSKIITTFEF